MWFYLAHTSENLPYLLNQQLILSSNDLALPKNLPVYAVGQITTTDHNIVLSIS